MTPTRAVESWIERFQYFFRFLILNEDIELIPIAILSPHMAELISRLLTWITLTVVFPVVMLSISGLVWSVFISRVFRGRDKVLNGTSPVGRDLGIEAMQNAANITRNIPARLYIASLFYITEMKIDPSYENEYVGD